MARLLLAAALILWSVSIAINPETLSAQGAAPQPRITLRVPKSPTVVNGAAGAVLVYELHVTNVSAQQWTLQRVDVLSGTPDHRSLLTLGPPELGSTIARPGTALAEAERRVLSGAAWGVIYLWVPVDRTAPPLTVRHRLTLETSSDGTTHSGEIEGPPVPVSRELATIGPPLRGGPWRVGNGPSNDTPHRRNLVVLDGTLTGNERFAIDYVKIGDSNETFSGDRLVNQNHYAYGSEVLSVADGVVAAIKDGLPDLTPGPSSSPPTPETVAGNYIRLDIGQGRYAVYAHLKPGSLRVTVGQRVTRGQVIALVGNSGNSTAPHLHFQVQDASTLSAEALPYEHESFEVVGRCQGPGRGCTRSAAVVHRSEIPLNLMIVRFPE